MTKSNETTTEDNAKLLGAMTKVGQSLANTFIESDSKASATKRQALLSVANKYAGDKARISIILDAYAASMLASGLSDSICRVRKSEANAIMKAVALTQVTGDNLQKLSAHTGGYNELIDLARNLSKEGEAKEGIQTARKVTQRTELTEKQIEDVSTKIEHASLNQLATMVTDASVQINKSVSPNMAGMQQLILISNIANAILNNPDLEKYVHNVANEIVTISEKAVETMRKTMQDTQQAIEATKNNVTLEVEVTA